MTFDEAYAELSKRLPHVIKVHPTLYVDRINWCSQHLGYRIYIYSTSVGSQPVHYGMRVESERYDIASLDKGDWACVRTAIGSMDENFAFLFRDQARAVEFKLRFG